MRLAAFGLLLLCGLAAANPARTEITYLGGKGVSFNDAVLIHGAEGELDGVPAEYDWLDQHLPGYQVLSQALLQDGGHIYDMLDVRQNGVLTRVFFDITEYFGK